MTSSSMQEVKSGVPQGSVLGPVLFFIFINDMPLFINEAYAEVYADDTAVHAAHKDQNVVKIKLQNSAIDYKSWCIQHKMFVNLTKISFMTIGTRQNLSNIHDINIIIDNEHISKVDNQKRLGIIIEKQIDSACLNITRRITLLKMLYKYVDRSSLKQYYNSYKFPIFIMVACYGASAQPIIWIDC